MYPISLASRANRYGLSEKVKACAVACVPVVLACLALTSLASAWVFESPSYARVGSQDMGVDADGNVFAKWRCLGSAVLCEGVEKVVIKLDAQTGVELWRWTAPTTNPGPLVVDGAGDVVIAFNVSGIYKLDGATGAVLWGPIGAQRVGFWGHGLAVDGTDDIYVAGQDATGTEFEIVKLSGATGAELWREGMCCGSFSKVAIDSAGNAIAAGQSYDAMTDQRDIAVMKYSADGLEVWDQPMIIAGGSRSTGTQALAVDGSADVFVAGWLNGTSQVGESIVVKLSGATGAELWRQTWATTSGYVWGAPDGAGDVIACCIPLTGGVGTVKFAGATGAELWSQSPTIPDFELFDATLDHLGHAVLVGRNGSILSKVNGDDGTEDWGFTAPPRALWGVVVDHLDNVIVSAPGSGSTPGMVIHLPEPDSSLLLGAGIALTALLVRARRARLAASSRRI
jgi:hypothetical protein